MKKMLLATSGALALMMLLAGTVFAADTAATAPASAAAGQPAMDRDSDFGYYIWFDGDRIQLRTTDRGNGPGPSEYTGVITARNDAGGVDIGNVDLIKAENDDSAIAAGNKLDFRFRTYNGIDGVAFTAHDATRITFRLYRDGHLVSSDHIYLGAGEINPPGNPFALFLS
ncbi:MAG: hypothetical protein M3008_06710 [Chloroflexota bacterium]|nr:hypothetical protein [Chloroflexota bacterium]